MSIKFACTCGKGYKVPEKFSGKRVKCKRCGEPIRVPSQSQSGVVSQRASAVSKRSVLADAGKSSRRSSSKGSSRSSSRTSSRSSKRSGRSRRSSKSGGGTQVFKAVDLIEGNQVKKYAKKKDDEEFARGTGRLTYFENGKAVKAFRVSKKEAVIGRDEACQIQLPLDSISKQHAKIEYKLGTFILTDQQSTNGMVINGRTVRRSSLKNGDIIQMGEGILRLDC